MLRGIERRTRGDLAGITGEQAAGFGATTQYAFECRGPAHLTRAGADDLDVVSLFPHVPRHAACLRRRREWLATAHALDGGGEHDRGR